MATRQSAANKSAKTSAAAAAAKATKAPAVSASFSAKPKSKTVVKATSVTDQLDKKKDKTEKVKVVRDSFTIPKTEYAQIAAMKKRAMAMGLETKKSELIRAGLALLAGTSDTAFRKALGSVPTLKTGRPGKA